MRSFNWIDLNVGQEWSGVITNILLIFLALSLISGCGEGTSQPDSAASPSPVSSTPSMSIRFTDVTADAGLHFQHDAGATGKKWYPETMGAGGGFLDYDGDGWLDILFVNSRHWPEERHVSEPTMHLYRNQGDGTFRDVTRESRLDVPLYGMGMAAADYDNDGDTDIVVTGYELTRLFRNEGDGTFTDMSETAGLAQDAWSTAAVFVDIDRDGKLDLLVGQYVNWSPAMEKNIDCTYGTPLKDYCAVTFFSGQGLRLYRNLGADRFRDITNEAGLAVPDARVLGLTIVDDNQDVWPDILVANDLTPSLFFKNQGNGTFREIGVQSGLVIDEGGVAFAGMGIDTAYVNNDDQMCIAIGNFAGQPTTLHCQLRVGANHHADVFAEQSHRFGLAQPTLRMVTFGLFFFDADLDGWQDLFLLNGHVANEERLRNVPYAQPPQLFHNQRNGTFAEIGTKAGLTMRLVGRGAAHADYDRDGDLDVLIMANQGSAYLLRNDTPRSGHFLRVETHGLRSNRDGIGARLHLYTSRQKYPAAFVRTGGSYLSQSDTAVTYGLQSGETIDRLEVFWPSGAVDVFHDLKPDTTFVAREKEAVARADAETPVAPTRDHVNDLVTLKRNATAHYQAGRSQEAITAFKQVLQHAPNDYIAQQYLIELYWRRDERDSARILLETMSQTLPDVNFFMQFAFQLEKNDLGSLAEEVYQTAARLDPQAPEALYRLGKRALAAKQYDTALAYFQQALKRRPDLTEAQQGVGLVYVEQGKHTEAEAQFRDIIQQQPTYAEAYTHLGALYLRSGRLDEALQTYRHVTRLQPNQAQGFHNLGTVLSAQGKVEQAEEQFHTALRLDPSYAAAHNDLGTLYAEQGDIDGAITAFEAALRAQPQADEARQNLANAYYTQALAAAQNGQINALQTLLQRALQYDPDHAGAHGVLASIYFQYQQYDLAWQHGTRAAKAGAPVESLLNALIQMREKAGIATPPADRGQ